MSANMSRPRQPMTELKRTTEDLLTGLSRDELDIAAVKYAVLCGLMSDWEIVHCRIAAQLAQSPAKWEEIVPKDMILERTELARERSKSVLARWKLSFMMYSMALVTSLTAITQGMDEAVINGGQIFFLSDFGIEGNANLTGLVNGAPYLACAIFGSWISIPLNDYLGRHWAIFIACVVTILACIGQACTTSTWGLFAARFVLGIGIGVNSSTSPLLVAETAPEHVRGALGMTWQFFTAFGIMLGCAVSLVFYNVKDVPGIAGLNWRLMMGAPAVFALIVCCLVLWIPHSPRLLMKRHKHGEAVAAMRQLRPTSLQAIRDCFKAYMLMEAEHRLKEQAKSGRSALLCNRRTRNALIASELVMLTQQFCGINLIAYYSTLILKDAGFGNLQALESSFGLGAVNFVFAIPAFWLIDRFGRRTLLLCTLPPMAVFLLITGGSFYLDGSAHIGLVQTGLYLFMVCYSPGPGPVPFPYCAEVWPIEFRTFGMALNTATTWLFNFVLAYTFPSLKDRLGSQGVFFYYAGWNVLLYLLCFVFIRETKEKSLEELDQVFDENVARYLGRKVRDPCGRRDHRVPTYRVGDGPKSHDDELKRDGSAESRGAKGIERMASESTEVT